MKFSLLDLLRLNPPRKLHSPSRPEPSRGFSSCGTTALLLSLGGPGALAAALEMFSSVSAMDTDTESAATADDVVVVVVVAWEEVAMATSGWLPELSTPPTSCGFRAMSAEAPEAAGRSRGLAEGSVPAKLGMALGSRFSTLLLSGRGSGGAGALCCCSRSEMVTLKDGTGSMAAACAWFWSRAASSWKCTGCGTCPSTSPERNARAALTFGFRKPKGLRLTSDLPSPAEGWRMFKRFWLRRCC